MGLNWKFFHMWLQHMFPTFSSTVTLFQIHMWLQHVSYLLFHCYSILDPHVAPACFLPSLPLLLYSRKTALFTYPDQFSVSLRCSHHHWSWSPFWQFIHPTSRKSLLKPVWIISELCLLSFSGSTSSSPVTLNLNVCSAPLVLAKNVESRPYFP